MYMYWVCSAATGGQSLRAGVSCAMPAELPY